MDVVVGNQPFEPAACHARVAPSQRATWSACAIPETSTASVPTYRSVPTAVRLRTKLLTAQPHAGGPEPISGSHWRRGRRRCPPSSCRGRGSRLRRRARRCCRRSARTPARTDALDRSRWWSRLRWPGRTRADVGACDPRAVDELDAGERFAWLLVTTLLALALLGGRGRPAAPAPRSRSIRTTGRRRRGRGTCAHAGRLPRHGGRRLRPARRRPHRHGRLAGDPRPAPARIRGAPVRHARSAPADGHRLHRGGFVRWFVHRTPWAPQAAEREWLYVRRPAQE